MFLSPAGRSATLAVFGCEFFPHFLTEAESGLPFAEFFQQSRDGRAVGVIDLDLTTLP
jgi:hypothetical protein